MTTPDDLKPKYILDPPLFLKRIEYFDLCQEISATTLSPIASRIRERETKVVKYNYQIKVWKSRKNPAARFDK